MLYNPSRHTPEDCVGKIRFDEVVPFVGQQKRCSSSVYCTALLRTQATHYACYFVATHPIAKQPKRRKERHRCCMFGKQGRFDHRLLNIPRDLFIRQIIWAIIYFYLK